MHWKPFDLNEIQEVLNGFDRWFLDGGLSLDHFLGRSTRSHSDIDIGVLSEDKDDLLSILLKRKFHVLDACAGLQPITSVARQESSYNYWISDGEHYKVQVLVYSTDGDRVIFRRNPSVTWPKDSFILAKDGLRIVNPLVTYAFKITAKSVEPKDLADVGSFMKFIGTDSAKRIK